jgi:hypothetical protein
MVVVVVRYCKYLCSKKKRSDSTCTSVMMVNVQCTTAKRKMVLSCENENVFHHPERFTYCICLIKKIMYIKYKVFNSS